MAHQKKQDTGGGTRGTLTDRPPAVVQRSHMGGGLAEQQSGLRPLIPGQGFGASAMQAGQYSAIQRAQSKGKGAKNPSAEVPTLSKAEAIAQVTAESNAKFRIAPAGLEEQLAMEAAKSGQGEVCMGTDEFNDERINRFNIIKMEHVHRTQNDLGTKVKIKIHYFRDLDTGQDFAHKFKNAPFSTVRDF